LNSVPNILGKAGRWRWWRWRPTIERHCGGPRPQVRRWRDGPAVRDPRRGPDGGRLLEHHAREPHEEARAHQQRADPAAAVGRRTLLMRPPLRPSSSRRGGFEVPPAASSVRFRSRCGHDCRSIFPPFTLSFSFVAAADSPGRVRSVSTEDCKRIGQRPPSKGRKSNELPRELGIPLASDSVLEVALEQRIRSCHIRMAAGARRSGR
jgi:hypothetical protein